MLFIPFKPSLFVGHDGISAVSGCEKLHFKKKKLKNDTILFIFLFTCINRANIPGESSYENY
jgi:hypothetical protein